MAAAIRSAFPGDSLEIAPNQWLVAAAGVTTVDIVGRLGAQDGEKGRVIVVAVASYRGWHQNSIWEWIKAKMA